MSFSNDIKSIQKWVISIFNDPLAKILLNNSNLTKIQLETVLIDSLAEHILDRKIGYEEKAKMRLSVKGVSRGAFNRTLHQGRKNIMNSIYTILFLGYIGILETASLEPFIRVSNKLDKFMKEYLRAWRESNIKLDDKNKIKLLSMLKTELQISLNNLLLSRKQS